MSDIKYLLVAKMPEFETEFIHKPIQERIQKALPTFHLHQSSIGPHITICPPFKCTNEILQEIKKDLGQAIFELGPIPLQLIAWNYFKGDKSETKTIYRIVDAKEEIRQKLHSLNILVYEKKVSPVGDPHRFHLHQTLGSFHCTEKEFNQMKNALTWATTGKIDQIELPMELCVDHYALYQKAEKQEDWKEIYVFS